MKNFLAFIIVVFAIVPCLIAACLGYTVTVSCEKKT